MKTLDGAIFRRCHNEYNIMLENKLVLNEYVLYCSPFQQKMLANAQHWFIDSTFYIVPSSFYQFLVILIFEETTNLYMPVCFALASRKNEDIYKRIFRDVKEFILEKQYEMKRITIDFEKAQKEAASQIFPNTNFIGCKFHFLQAIRRKAEKKVCLIMTKKRKRTLLYMA